MKFDDVVLGRRSIRGFRPDPVPKSVIREVIELAMRAPSSLNTQPWNFYVVAGAALDRIRAGNTERNLAGVPSSREFRSHGEYGGAHRERQIEIAKQLIMICIAMGYPDDRFPANAVVSRRKSVEDAVVFVGFEE
jgi:nitroreductase